MKRCRVTATYKPNEAEVYQASISIPNSYPDALDEARVTVVKMVHDLLKDALDQVGRVEET